MYHIAIKREKHDIMRKAHGADRRHDIIRMTEGSLHNVTCNYNLYSDFDLCGSI